MLKGYKTYLVAAAAIVYAGLGYVLGYLDANAAMQIVLAALGGMGMRAGIKNEIARALIAQHLIDDTSPASYSVVGAQTSSATVRVKEALKVAAKVAPVFVICFVILPVMLTLSACNTLDIDKFANATTQQLQAADALARAQQPPDLAASTCYEGMLPVVQSIQAKLDADAAVTAQLSATGPIVDFQVLRDGVKTALGASGQLDLYQDAFNQSCGWLKTDAEKDVSRILIDLTPIGIHWF